MDKKADGAVDDDAGDGDIKLHAGVDDAQQLGEIAVADFVGGTAGKGGNLRPAAPGHLLIPPGIVDSQIRAHLPAAQGGNEDQNAKGDSQIHGLPAAALIHIETGAKAQNEQRGQKIDGHLLSPFSFCI